MLSLSELITMKTINCLFKRELNEPLEYFNSLDAGKKDVKFLERLSVE